VVVGMLWLGRESACRDGHAENEPLHWIPEAGLSLLEHELHRRAGVHRRRPRVLEVARRRPDLRADRTAVLEAGTAACRVSTERRGVRCRRQSLPASGSRWLALRARALRRQRTELDRPRVPREERR